MKRTPIIVPAQVYLHHKNNEYVVITKVNRGNIQFRGNGFYGMNETEVFFERLSPVDPEDLTQDEVQELTSYLITPLPLQTGWVVPDDDEDDEDFDV